MNAEQLQAAGFRSYSPNRDIGDRWTESWCYTRRDEQHNRLFHVHVRFWRHSDYSTHERPVEDGWDAWGQFRDSNGHAFHLTLLSVRYLSPPQVIDWFESAWSRLDCLSYDVD